jgi:hypothetical protein
VKRTGRTITRALAGLGVAAGVGWMALLGGPAHATAATQQTSDAAVTVSTQPVTTGCNQLTYTNLPVGGKVGDWVNANVSPASVAISIWHYDNASQHYQAMWFSNPQVPVDVPTFSQAVDAFFLCVSGNGTAP